MGKLVIVPLSITLILLQSGCVAPGVSEEIRAEFGTIAVASRPVSPEESFRELPKGALDEACRGAGTGALLALDWAGEGGEIGAAIGIVILVPAAVFRSVYGAMTAPSTESVEQVEATFRKVIVDLGIHKSLRDQILEATREKTNCKLTSLQDQPPMTGGETLADTITACDGINTIIEIAIEPVALRGGFIHHPEFVVSLTAHVTINRAEDRTLLYERPFSYESSWSHTLEEWAANDGLVFVQDVRQGVKYLARRIVEELFLHYRFP
jgi:hypothetical protein